MPCRTCPQHLALRSIKVGVMWVALWGCTKRKIRFGNDADFKSGKNFPKTCKEKI